MSFIWESEENKLRPRARRAKQIIAINTVAKNQSTKPQILGIQEVPSVIIKQATLEIGRYCKCGCGRKIPMKARKDRVFFSSRCRGNYQSSIRGFIESKFVLRARIRINEPRTIFIYPAKGYMVKIPITKEYGILWDLCDKLENERLRN